MSRSPTTITAVTVSSAGTAVALVSSTAPIYASTIILEADSDNAGNIFWGGSTVDADNGNTLIPGQSCTITFDKAAGPDNWNDGNKIDMSSIYVDAATNDDKCRVTYFAWPG